MLANRREKIIAMVLVAALGLLVVDQYVLTPYLDEHARVEKALQDATLKKNDAQRLLQNRVKTNSAWKDLQAQGLLTDPAAAESQALHHVRDWAERSRVDLQSLRPDRVARVGDFQQIRIQAAGTASTASFANLLSEIESAKIPMRVNELRLASRKEGADDLTFSLSVSTIVFSPAPEKKPAARPASKGEAQ